MWLQSENLTVTFATLVILKWIIWFEFTKCNYVDNGNCFQIAPYYIKFLGAIMDFEKNT